jgi:hypothetical protein
MKKLKWYFAIGGILFLFLVGGCTKEAPTVTQQGFIADMTQNQLLVRDIYFSIDDAKLISDSGMPIKPSELRIGMEVGIQYNGIVAESFPGQAKADKVIVKTHEDHLKAEEAVSAIIQHAEKHYPKPIIILGSDSVPGNQFWLEVRVLSEENTLHLQYDYQTKTVSLVNP